MTSEDPGSSVNRPASSPPVHDSATAIVSPRERSSASTCSSTVVPSSENSVSACRARDERGERVVDLRVGRLVARDDLDLAAPQARRDLQALELDPRLGGGPQRRRDLRLGDPVEAQHRAPVLDRARQRRPHRRASARRSPTSAAARAAGPAARRPSARRRTRGVTTRPGAVPTGSRITAPAGITACLRLDASTASGSRSGQRAISGLQDLPDPPFQRLVEHHLATGEAPDDLRRQVVGRRPEPAARDDERAALAREEAQRPQDLLRPVADDDDRRRVRAQLEQPVRQPRAVAIRDAPGQHLGAGDDDPRADAHGLQTGRLSADSGWRPPRGVICMPIGSADGATPRERPLMISRTPALPSVRRKRRDRKVRVRCPGRERLAVDERAVAGLQADVDRLVATIRSRTRCAAAGGGGGLAAGRAVVCVAGGVVAAGGAGSSSSRAGRASR